MSFKTVLLVALCILALSLIAECRTLDEVQAHRVVRQTEVKSSNPLATGINAATQLATAAAEAAQKAIQMGKEAMQNAAHAAAAGTQKIPGMG